MDENFQGPHLIYTNQENGCFSYVGRQGTGTGQRVNLGSPGCLKIGTILHETLHGLGLLASLPNDLNLQVLRTNTQDLTAITTFPFFWKMCSVARRTTFVKRPMTLSVAEGLHLISTANTF